MSRKLKRTVVACLSVGLIGVVSFPLSAQGPLPQADPMRRERPAAEPLRVPQVPPALDRVLKSWEEHSAQIQKLEGIHRRFVYDKVFNVEKRADGVFYYEAPDKGRIDIKATSIPRDQVSQRKDPSTGQPFKLEPDRPEKWICTGQNVLLIKDTEKVVEVFPLPEEARGQHIMDGPLPFLFGMPAEKAKLRFDLKLLKETEQQVWISATPRRNEAYKEAKIILDKSNWLPSAVQLIDPAGNLETVYTFAELKINQKPGFLDVLGWGQKPFAPPLQGYRTIHNRPQAAPQQAMDGVPHHVGEPQPGGPAAQPNVPPQPNVPAAPPRPNMVPVPSLVGLPYKEAQAVLEQLGLTAQFKRGPVAARQELVFVVHEQDPPHRAVVPKGEPVTLTLYIKPDPAPPRTSQREE